MSEEGLERGEIVNLEKNDSNRVYKITLFNALSKKFYKHKNDFSYWILEKYSQEYERLTLNSLTKLFKLKPKIIEKYKELVNEKKINGKSSSVSLRVYFNYLDDKELLNKPDLKYLRDNIKIIRNKGIDTYVPSKFEIEKSIEQLSQRFPKEYVVLYNFIIQSGCRFTELKNFIVNYDEKYIEKFDEIVIYRNFFIRGQKSSYYLFFTKEMYSQIYTIKDNLTRYDLERFKDRIVRDKEIIPVKYLRKYNFTLLIENGVSFEIANFIQGRTSQNIGFNHYLAKKVVAVKEYNKIL
jgi:intergrase/recombinase